MQANELRKMSVSELNEKLAGFREELFNLRFQHSTAQLENTARLPEVKKSIARIMTILNEKEGEA
jgi:large subunit ribosomal protein L29